MISVLNLIWIIPLSMVAGAAGLVCVACAVVDKQADEELKEIDRMLEESSYD
jgi:hypothetical protein